MPPPPLLLLPLLLLPLLLLEVLTPLCMYFSGTGFNITTQFQKNTHN
jgi:hypothetical protein